MATALGSLILMVAGPVCLGSSTLVDLVERADRRSLAPTLKEQETLSTDTGTEGGGNEESDKNIG